MKKIIMVSIEEIRVGDTVIDINNEEKTVCSNNISKNGFMGMKIYGDSYLWQGRKVKKVIYPKWVNGKLIN